MMKSRAVAPYVVRSCPDWDFPPTFMQGSRKAMHKELLLFTPLVFSASPLARSQKSVRNREKLHVFMVFHFVQNRALSKLFPWKEHPKITMINAETSISSYSSSNEFVHLSRGRGD